MTKEEIIDNIARLNSETWKDREEVRTEIGKLLSELKKALEQQPSDDEITIIMKKGTLKYSGQGYVAYKKDWFRKHFATEVEIMTYFDGYRKEQEKIKSSVLLSEIYRVIAGHSDYHGDNILAALTCIAEGKEVDTVKPLSQPTSDDCVSRAEMLKYQQYLRGKMSNEENHKLWEFIKALPPVTPTQSWVPVSERLPASDEDVVVTNGKGMYIGWIDPTDKCWRVDSTGEYFMNDIVAWQPLPQPYEEKGDSSNGSN